VSTNEHWQNRPEGGSFFGMWVVRTIALHGGRGLARACLYPITLYFYLRRKPERVASQQYLQRVFGKPATARQVFRHMHSYAATSLDRIFLLARGEKQFQIETQGLELLDESIARGQGVLLFGSHQGSFEALRTVGVRRPDMSVRVVLDKQKTPAMTKLLEDLAPDIGAKVIDASQDGTSIALAMAEACQGGAMVAAGAYPAGAGGTVLWPVSGRQPLPCSVRGDGRPGGDSAQGARPRPGRVDLPLCPTPGTLRPCRSLQLVQLL
jgi:predicted LPLAT superfamily acyltransferase